MQAETSHKVDEEIKTDPLMDSNQFERNQVDLIGHELTGAMGAQGDTDVTFFKDANDGLPELQESAEPKRPHRNGRYNLRQSLAWDSSFFTSAGVLDPEELSTMITGADKGGHCLLPGIEEDISVSTESISTLQSDNLTLENLEDDLFMDIRASIQRSSTRASNLTCSSRKPTVVEVDNAAISSLEKEDKASQIKNKKPALKKNSSLQPVRMSKCQPKQIIEKPGMGRALKQEQAIQMKSTAKTGDSKLILPRPPKGINMSMPASTDTTKRDSVGTSRGKPELGNSKHAVAPSKNMQSSKVPVLSGARRALPKPAAFSKSSSLASLTTSKQHSTKSSASSDCSSGMSSETTATSPLMTARRKPVKNSNVGATTSVSISKTPSRAALKNKAPSSTLSAYLTSAKKSSSVSPASSVSEWSSASSSCSILNRKSLESSNSRSMDDDITHSGLRCHAAGQNIDGHGISGNVLLANNSKGSSTQAGGLRGPSRPSGLRMPSPKIGFFDGVKSSGRTPNGPPQPQSSLHAVLPKSGAATSSTTSNTNSKLKNSKVPTARTVAGLANTKSDSPKAVCPASFQENTPAPVKDTCVSADVTHSHSSCHDINVTGENCHKEAKILVKDGINPVEDAIKDLNASCNIVTNEKDLNMCEIMNPEDVKTATSERSSASDFKNNTQKGDGDENELNHLKNGPCPIPKADDNENGLICEGEKLTGCNDYLDPKFPLKDDQSAASRAPLALKNVFCYDECMDAPKESVTHFKDTNLITLPTSE